MLCAHEVATPRETSGVLRSDTRSLWSSKGRTVCERIPLIKWSGTHKNGPAADQVEGYIVQIHTTQGV